MNGCQCFHAVLGCGALRGGRRLQGHPPSTAGSSHCTKPTPPRCFTPMSLNCAFSSSATPTVWSVLPLLKTFPGGSQMLRWVGGYLCGTNWRARIQGLHLPSESLSAMEKLVENQDRTRLHQQRLSLLTGLSGPSPQRKEHISVPHSSSPPLKTQFPPHRTEGRICLNFIPMWHQGPKSPMVPLALPHATGQSKEAIVPGQ